MLSAHDLLEGTAIPLDISPILHFNEARQTIASAAVHVVLSQIVRGCRGNPVYRSNLKTL